MSAPWVVEEYNHEPQRGFHKTGPVLAVDANCRTPLGYPEFHQPEPRVRSPGLATLGFGVQRLRRNGRGTSVGPPVQLWSERSQGLVLRPRLTVVASDLGPRRSQRFERLRHVDRKRRFERQRPPRVGMPEFELVGVQRLPADEDIARVILNRSGRPRGQWWVPTFPNLLSVLDVQCGNHSSMTSAIAHRSHLS